MANHSEDPSQKHRDMSTFDRLKMLEQSGPGLNDAENGIIIEPEDTPSDDPVVQSPLEVDMPPLDSAPSDQTDMATTPVNAIPTTHPEFDLAWQTLEKALPGHVVTALRGQASALRLPTWQLGMGVLIHDWQSGTLCSPVLEPSWRQPHLIITQSVPRPCKRCGKEFIPPDRGVEHCSQECGMAEYEEKMEARRSAANRIRLAEMKRAAMWDEGMEDEREPGPTISMAVDPEPLAMPQQAGVL